MRVFPPSAFFKMTNLKVTKGFWLSGQNPPQTGTELTEASINSLQKKFNPLNF